LIELNPATVKKLEELIDNLFSDYDPATESKVLTFSTVHKSKGLEWPTVFLLGRNLWMPSPMAEQPWELEQEKNLIYVAITRAMLHLVEVNVEE
jgi:superfamily I DNA/RNA helicase